MNSSGIPPVVIVGLDSLPGIQAARILAYEGIPILAIAQNPDHHCCRTRVCQEIHFANTSDGSFLQTLKELGPRLSQRAVLLPCTDMSVWHISRSRNDLDQWYFIMLPDHQVVSTLLDKVNFYQFSQSEGLPIPVTYLLRNQSDADLAVSKLNFPCILKPTKRTPAWTKNNEQKVYKVADSHEFQQVYKRCSPWADALIVQDWVSGPDSNLYSCNCYFDAESRPLITFTARKLRQWPPEAGISCLGQECRNDTVLNATVELFTKAGFQGLGYVEMKQDALTGKYFILEANVGRPTVRSAIAEAGGVPLLKSAYCDTVGWQLPQNRTQQYGSVKWIHWHYDIRSAYRYWRRGELSLANWRRSWGGPKVYALFTWRDPTPFWYDLVSTAGRLISRARKKFN